MSTDPSPESSPAVPPAASHATGSLEGRSHGTMQVVSPQAFYQAAVQRHDIRRILDALAK